ncbi:MAG: hypothetical protein GEU79_16195 [Acidimicrobiia bacterium]|nr:hypothetical protein [Acidimicrobiia bacterium]
MAGLFVSPHSSDDTVGELAFVGASGFSAGLAFGFLAGQVFPDWLVVAFLGDGGYVLRQLDIGLLKSEVPVYV